MKKLLNIMRLQALLAQSGRVQTRLGTVVAYNPDDYTVKVAIQPEGVHTGWIPLGAAWVGNGWGMFAPPSGGELVEVEFQEGSPESGIAVARLFNDEERPLPVPGGEFWLVHRLGASFKLTNDGAGTFSDGHGASVRLNGDGTITSEGAWTHGGSMTVVGEIVGQGGMAISGGTGASMSVSGDLHVTGGDVVADTISLKTHKHGGVQTGAGVSGGPQ